MSRKIRKVVASTLALAMMAGTVSSMPAGQFTAIINVSAADQVVTTTTAAGGVAGPKVDAGKYEVKAGETFKIKIKVTDNAEGFNALNAWLDYDKSVFEIVSIKAGDTDDPDNDDSDAYSYVTTNDFQKKGASANQSTVLALYSDTENHIGDETLATVTVKVNANAADGDYSMAFDAKGDGGAMANRLDGNRKVIVINPTYYGAAVKVGNGGTVTPTVSPSPVASPSPVQSATPQSGSLTGKIADASGTAGSSVKTTLTISGASIAGFTADLSVPSGLELTGATASGWDIEVNGKQIVALANPYQDNSSATVNLEFKAASAGNYDVSVAKLTGAPKDGSKEISGTGSKGTITVSGGQAASPAPTSATSPSPAPTASTNPGTQTPNADAIQIKIGTVSNAKAGETVKVPVYADNIGGGFSTVQFDYVMDESFKVSKVTKGEVDGSWTVGKEQRALQFLSGDGNNIAEGGKIGTIQVVIPEGTANGVYKIDLKNFEGSSFSTADKKQVALSASAFAGVSGAIGVGVEVSEEASPAPTSATSPSPVPTAATSPSPAQSPTPGTTTPAPTSTTGTVPGGSAEQTVTKTDVAGVAGPKVDAGKYTAKPGDTIKVKIKVTDNADGFNALNAWLDYNKDVFEVVSFKAGDTDDPENDDSDAYSYVTTNQFKKPGAKDNEGTLLALYSDTENHVGDETLATITMKVSASAANGYYNMNFDAKGDGGAMANRLGGDRKVVVINPTFYGAVVKVDGGDDVTPTTSPAPTSTPASPAPTSTTTSPAPTTPVGSGIVITMGEVKGAKPGDTVKVPITVSNIGDGFSTVQFDYVMDETFKIKKATKGEIDGSWTVGKVERALQFLSGDGNNITSEGILGNIQIEIPADAKEGTYTIELKNFTGSSFSSADKKQLELGNDAFTGVTGKIVIGTDDTDPTTSPDPTTPPTSTTTTPAPDDDFNYDVDDNGTVNAQDLVALKRFLLMADAKAPKNGDVNKDGAINAQDYARVLKKLLK